MSTTQYFDSSKLAAALATVGGTALGENRNDLLKQCLIAAALRTGGGGGSGDVVGPSSSTDGAAALWDGLTGKLLKNSSVFLTGSGTVAFGAGPFTLTVPATGTAALLGVANVFTTLQTITQGNANTGVLASTGYSLTGSNATSMIDLAGTWNTSGNPTAVKLNITNTASGSSSLLMDLQLGGVSKMAVYATGGYTLSLAQGVTAQGSFNLQSTWGVSGASGNQTMYTTASFGWAPGNAGADVAADALFRRKAPGSIQMGTDAASSQVSQIFSACGARVGTDTNTTPTNTFTLVGPHNTGTGTGGDLRLGVYGTNGVSGTAIGTLNTVLTIVAARKVVNISSIPTSSAGLSSGDVYSNAGVLTIVP